VSLLPRFCIIPFSATFPFRIYPLTIDEFIHRYLHLVILKSLLNNLTLTLRDYYFVHSHNLRLFLHFKNRSAYNIIKIYRLFPPGPKCFSLLNSDPGPLFLLLNLITVTLLECGNYSRRRRWQIRIQRKAIQLMLSCSVPRFVN